MSGTQRGARRITGSPSAACTSPGVSRRGGRPRDRLPDPARHRHAGPGGRARRRVGRRDPAVRHVRGAQRHHQPRRQRAGRRRGSRRATGVVRPELAAGRRREPRRPQAAHGGGAAVVPVHRRGDGVRHRQLRRDVRGGRRGVRRRDRLHRRPVPEGAHLARVDGHRRRTAAPRAVPPLGRRAGRAARHRAGRRRGARRRADDLHVGHHRQAQGRDAHRRRPRPHDGAAERARLPPPERGAPHHRADVPLRSAGVRVAGRAARAQGRAAPEVRRGRGGSSSSPSTG